MCYTGGLHPLEETHFLIRPPDLISGQWLSWIWAFMVVDSDLLSLYTSAGLNVLHWRASPDGGDSFSDTTTGFNLGAGAELDLGFGRAFGEAKYVLGSDRDEQLVLGAGIRVSLSN